MMQHVLGQKQFEVTNHLGNVLATVSDKRYEKDTNNDNTIDRRLPSLVAAYDYYPYGMLMPGRFTQDTSTQCMTITQTVLVPHLVLAPMQEAPWTSMNAGTVVMSGLRVIATGSQPGDGGKIVVDAEPKTHNQVYLRPESTEGDIFRASVTETIDGVEHELASINIGNIPEYMLDYVPSGSNVTLKLAYNGKPGNMSTLKLTLINLYQTVYDPQNIAMTICNKGIDKYRFGFNGQMKDNEIAGVGNHLEFKYRGYDSRLGRFNSIDPLTKKYPWNSSYAFAENRVIDGLDFEGKEWYRAVGKWLYGNTLIGLVDNTKTLVVSAAQGDKSAQLALISYTGSRVNEGKQVFSKGTRTEKEEYITNVALDAAAAIFFPRLIPEGRGASSRAAPKAGTTLAETDAAAATKALEPINVSDQFLESLGESEIRDSKNNLVGTVRNVDGYLDMYVKTKGTGFEGRGNEVFQALVKHAQSKGDVKGINGSWSAGELGSNLRAFNKAIQNNASPEEAAFETFTGDNARDLGFKNVQIQATDGTKGNYNHVSVTYTK